MPVSFGGHDLPPLVEIGLTDLPKSEVAMHSAAAAIYGKKFFLDFMLIFEKFRLFYDVGTHFWHFCYI